MSSATHAPSKMLHERLLITKIVTGLALVFLLVVAVWSADHSETNGVASVASAAATTSDGAVAAVLTSDGRWGMASDVESFPTEIAVGLSADDSGGVLAGFAGCLLGIFCGLLLLALVRLHAQRFRPKVLGAAPRVLDPVKSVARLFTPPLSLTQLSLSRT
ncbi:MAG: hypothetical protein ABWY26_09205 [Microbacterium sp.]